MKIQIDKNGYYGESDLSVDRFGGAFIPEMMHENIKELQDNYVEIIEEPSFIKEYKSLLKDYVGRPSPLFYAESLSIHYETNIYLKREDLNHTGSHKINNTIGQILLAEKLGKKRIIAETGAGQHGVATATVCALKNMECVIYMGEEDVQRQAPNVARIKMLGGKVIPVTSGNKTLKDATNEALRDWIFNPIDTHYIIGSVVGPHPYPDMVTRFQSIISKEMKLQLIEKTGKPDPCYILACIGGGSNAAGIFYHYLNDENVKLIAAEGGGKGVETNEHAATISKGKPGVLHASKSLLMQTKDGQIIEPYSISAGLDYPGVGPLHAYLNKIKRASYISVTDQEALNAAFRLTQLEGIIPALESAHALALLEKLEFKANDIVVINLSGRGDKDLNTYLKHVKDE